MGRRPCSGFWPMAWIYNCHIANQNCVNLPQILVANYLQRLQLDSCFSSLYCPSSPSFHHLLPGLLQWSSELLLLLLLSTNLFPYIKPVHLGKRGFPYVTSTILPLKSLWFLTTLRINPKLFGLDKSPWSDLPESPTHGVPDTKLELAEFFPLWWPYCGGCCLCLEDIHFYSGHKLLPLNSESPLKYHLLSIAVLGYLSQGSSPITLSNQPLYFILRPLITFYKYPLCLLLSSYMKI